MDKQQIKITIISKCKQKNKKHLKINKKLILNTKSNLLSLFLIYYVMIRKEEVTPDNKVIDNS